jgi:hypothetical protein
MSALSTLKRWHDIVASGEMSGLTEIFHADATFRSPAVHKPYQGRKAAVFLLSNVFKVFENFTYHREWVSDDGSHAALEFSANIGDKNLKGIDLISFNAEGLITDFEVMMRPVSGLMALGGAMGPRVGNYFKT